MPNELPMHEIVKMVLRAESESRRLLEEADAAAGHLTSEARRRVQELLQKMNRETAAEADAIVRAAEQAADRQRQEQLAGAAREIEASAHLDEAAERELVEAVVRCVKRSI